MHHARLQSLAIVVIDEQITNESCSMLDLWQYISRQLSVRRAGHTYRLTLIMRQSEDVERFQYCFERLP